MEIYTQRNFVNLLLLEIICNNLKTVPKVYFIHGLALLELVYSLPNIQFSSVYCLIHAIIFTFNGMHVKIGASPESLNTSIL